MAIELSPPTTYRPLQAPQPAMHEPLQAKALFPAMVETKAKNLPPPKVDS